MRRSLYTRPIIETLQKQGRDANPYHVEAFMRLEYKTLDHLGGRRWDRAVAEAAEAVLIAGPEDSEALAATYGLRKEN